MSLPLLPVSRKTCSPKQELRPEKPPVSCAQISKDHNYMLKCCSNFSSISPHPTPNKNPVTIVPPARAPSRPHSGSVSCREQHQLPAEDGLGEDRLPALWLPHRPVALERVQWPHAPQSLQLRLVVSEVGDSGRGWIRAWKLRVCKDGGWAGRKKGPWRWLEKDGWRGGGMGGRNA